MFRLFILISILLGSVINTSAIAVSSADNSEHKSSIEYLDELGINTSDFESINAGEVNDLSNKLRIVCSFIATDIFGSGLKLPDYYDVVGCANFILFESDNSPPVC